MAELNCSDGTKVKISDETEKELRVKFGPPKKKEGFEPIVVGSTKVFICDSNSIYPIRIDTDFDGSGHDTEDLFCVAEAKKLISTLQSAIAYCEKPAPKKEVFYKVGDRFIDEEDGSKLVLANASSQGVALVEYEGKDMGNRQSDPVYVENRNKITEAEFAKICGIGNFTLIE